MSEDVSQKTIEFFLQKCNITDNNKKAQLLSSLTDLIYDYNMAVVEYEKETDSDRKTQIKEELQELEEKITESCQK
jgi:hypothetical protein